MMIGITLDSWEGICNNKVRAIDLILWFSLGKQITFTRIHDLGLKQYFIFLWKLSKNCLIIQRKE